MLTCCLCRICACSVTCDRTTRQIRLRGLMPLGYRQVTMSVPGLLIPISMECRFSSLLGNGFSRLMSTWTFISFTDGILEAVKQQYSNNLYNPYKYPKGESVSIRVGELRESPLNNPHICRYLACHRPHRRSSMGQETRRHPELSQQE